MVWLGRGRQLGMGRGGGGLAVAFGDDLIKVGGLGRGEWLNFKFFFFNEPATTEIYTLSLHDALPISAGAEPARRRVHRFLSQGSGALRKKSEEHTSELKSLAYIVCRLLLEKTKI